VEERVQTCPKLIVEVAGSVWAKITLMGHFEQMPKVEGLTVNFFCSNVA
jgi:hypothetical protein